MSSTATSFAPLAASTGQPVKLAMQRLWLTGQVLPAGARLTVQHVFRTEEDKPVEVIYCFPLPRDAALRRFRITGEGFEAHSELRETEAAVKAYEEGIARGSLSTLARAYGDGVVNLTVGNIRPKETVTVYLEILAGVELNDTGLRFRFPFTLAPAYHSRAKAVVTAQGRGEMELPPDEFGDVILPPFHEDASALHQVGFELSVISERELDEIGSPSHGVSVKQERTHSTRVALGAAKDVPDRDLVLDARFKEVGPQVLAGRTKDGKGHFAAIVPSSSFGANTESPRRVVMLLDRSGSMQGSPILQARKAIEACLAILSDTDSFGLVAFDSSVETFRPALVAGSRENRDQAHQFLQTIGPRGGTELVHGIREAAKIFEGEGGDVLILTDGQVAGTEEILAQARAANMRLHCLGIGSASQDRFLTLLARETGGVSRFVTPRERVDLSALDLFASIGRPVASELRAHGNIEPEPPSVVFSGHPVLVFGETGEAPESRVELTWQGGQLSLPITFADSDIGETVWLLQGSRLITDWESRYPSTEALAPLIKRKQSRVAGRLLALSQMYRLASREMSLVAVVKRAGDRPGVLPDTRVVPVGMPQDTKFGAYFGDFADIFSSFMYNAERAASPPPGTPVPTAQFADFHAPEAKFAKTSFGSLFRAKAERKAARPVETAEDVLLNLASHMEPDGGMPGTDPDSRASASIAALLAFLSQGHTLSTGAFRSHVARLESFLKSLSGLMSDRQQVIAAVLDCLRSGKAPDGDWLALARQPGDHWKHFKRALHQNSRRDARRAGQ